MKQKIGQHFYGCDYAKRVHITQGLSHLPLLVQYFTFGMMMQFGIFWQFCAFTANKGNQ